MSISIEEALTEARLPTSPRDFDVSAALRRLAVDVRRVHTVRAARTGTSPTDEARRKLDAIARWMTNRPDAATRTSRLVYDPSHSRRTAQERLDIEGALIFACLLYLTQHRESARLWWQLTAGAGHRTAAYCLHLHHLELGQQREARHWLQQATETPCEPRIAPPVEGFYGVLEVFARISRRNGTATRVPTASIQKEVNRLAEDSPLGWGIVPRPDRRLTDRLHDATRR
ncbi:hypothetical protein [Streptomyces specialis]|uniref:hypothetical protein n=1 Tax=Streptomyces specialis TaxID=498367 RepID=UPI00073F6197|nr:hypothetical protein [Streptomyces specialis]